MKLKVVAVCRICVHAWKRIKSLHYAGNNLAESFYESEDTEVVKVARDIRKWILWALS